MSDPAPIALFAYRRPEHTRRTLRALQENSLARDSNLTIFSDAAKSPEHEADVRAVRALVREDWGFRSINVVERERNFGLAKSITDGVGRLCEEHGRVVAIEDDITVAPECLGFLNRALDCYAGEEKVHQVSAYSFPAGFSSSADTFFLPIISCWGWATWARAWRHFDPSLPGLDRLRVDATLRRKFNLNDAYDYFDMACQQARGEIDSWGVCWQLNTFMRDALVLYPKQSLARNQGVDSTGTHGAGETRLQPPLSSRRFDPVSMQVPERVEADPDALSQVANLLASLRPGVAHRIAKWIRA